MKPQREIEILIRAKYPIIYVVTWEEERVAEAIDRIAHKLKQKVYTWSLTQGMKPTVPEKGPKHPSAGKLPGEIEALAQIHHGPEDSIFHFKDLHHYMNDVRVIRLLRDLADRLRGRSQCLVITSPVLKLPTEVEKDITVVDFGLPGNKEIEEVLDTVLKAVEKNPQVKVNLDAESRELIIKSCQGLTLDEVEAVLARSLVEKKSLDIDVILKEKKQIVRKSGLLEYYSATETLGNVGGMESLKKWLAKRTQCFTDKAQEFGLPAPKGVLRLGAQGCGKSLIARAIASHWSLPMLRMDVGKIFGSLVGQSEENVRRAIRVAEGVSPCVLWADELDKGFAGVHGSGYSDSGTTARVFATFLTWMQEKTAPVFLIATANDVTRLPPELLRKGRFDEVFFIDLPEQDERKEIFRIHIAKRKRKPDDYDLDALAAATKGFSGAEIEQIVVGALFSAFDAGRDLSQDDLLSEAEVVVPLSVMMREDIDELREWAHLRARPAGRRESEVSPDSS